MLMSTLSDSEIIAANICPFCGTPHRLQRVVERDDDCARCHSPLFPAARHRLEYLGQRMLSRIPKQRGIAVYVSWPQPEPFAGEMRDLSLNGMQFAASMYLHENQIVKIDCAVLGALARVAYSARDTMGLDRWISGVEFLTLRFRQQRGSFVSAHA